jgi:hypothetical protein
MKLHSDFIRDGACHGLSKSNFYRRAQSDWHGLTPNLQADPVFALDSEIPRTLRALPFKTID